MRYIAFQADSEVKIERFIEKLNAVRDTRVLVKGEVCIAEVKCRNSSDFNDFYANVIFDESRAEKIVNLKEIERREIRNYM